MGDERERERKKLLCARDRLSAEGPRRRGERERGDFLPDGREVADIRPFSCKRRKRGVVNFFSLAEALSLSLSLGRGASSARRAAAARGGLGVLRPTLAHRPPSPPLSLSILSAIR